MKTFITIKEAAQMMNCSQDHIRQMIKKGIFREEKQGTKKVYQEEIEEYIMKENTNRSKAFWVLTYEQDESFRPLDSYNNFCGLIDPEKFSFTPGYWISNYGKVYNAKTNHIVSPQKVSHGYLEVQMNNDGIRLFSMLHILVAMLWCENGKFKQYVHHIDRNKTNNNYVNLIWVTFDEHDELHRLLDNGEEERYKERIEEIRNENRWTEKIKWIPHPDYKSDYKNRYYMYVTEKGYNDFIAGEEIDSDDIRGEIQCSCKPKKEDRVD